jgi:EpsI family protein
MAIVALCFCVSAGLLARASQVEAVPARESLAGFPLEISGWSGQRGPEFSEAIRRELGVDEYVNATFTGPSRSVVGLYLGYYGSQRQGDAIHSPANCLPGAGWQPVAIGRLRVDVGQPVDVNRWVIQKGEDRQVVLYWYQSHGRVVASEYASKIHLVFDAIRLNRTDAALVRVVTPIAGDSPNERAAAEQVAVAFVKSLFPLLGRFLPA